jgi:predicted nucleotidyltransferase component of viral defense system
MNKLEASFTGIHEDPDLFREAVNFTAAETSFLPRLIEKDYFSTLLLKYLSMDDTLVFKGGTCLAKIHAGFHRLSEDIDFAISISVESSRSERSRRAAPLKQRLAELPAQIPVFNLLQRLTGANNSTQYIALVGYKSLLSQQKETIYVELGLREPILMSVSRNPARTLLLDPVSHKSFVVPIAVSCLSEVESFAEKYRAALCRREAAIRDFYDIDYAVRKNRIHPLDAGFIRLVRQKLAVPGNEPIDVSSGRLSILRQQIESELRPVLRDSDFAEFDLARAFKTVSDMAAKMT